MVRFNRKRNVNEICLVEIFKSIDGEAFHSGQATVFVRTFGCNLRCSFCDSKMTWTEQEYKDCYNRELIWMSANDIFNAVENLENNFKYKSICLTGGEPLLEENKEFMMNELIPLFIQNRYAVNIETDGGIDYTDYKEKFGNPVPLDAFGNRLGVTLITDWKLPCSKMNSKMIASNLKVLSKYDVIKCVISDDEADWKEFENICKSGTEAKIYLSPVFGKVTMNKIPEFVFNHPEYGIIAQVQAHKIFWDPNMVGV